MTKIKNVLISQPEPADISKSPYKSLVETHHLNLTFFKFFDIVGVEAKDFRKERIYLKDYTAVIFNSKNAINHYFRLAKELREEIPDSMKYFCASEAIALYLQNYILYRKRKIFFGKQTFADLIDVMYKHKDEKFLFPCSDEPQTETYKLLDKAKYKYTKACMYKSIPKDLKSLNVEKFDMVVVFTPIGVKALATSYPKLDTEKTMIAAFGASTHVALAEAGFKLTVPAPTRSAPSMTAAIEDFILGKVAEPVLIKKPAILKKATTKKTTTKQNKPIIANKAKYDELLENKRKKALEKKEEALRRKAEKERLLLETQKKEENQ